MRCVLKKNFFALLIVVLLVSAFCVSSDNEALAIGGYKNSLNIITSEIQAGGVFGGKEESYEHQIKVLEVLDAKKLAGENTHLRAVIDIQELRILKLEAREAELEAKLLNKKDQTRFCNGALHACQKGKLNEYLLQSGH